ncbi:hypothetical protein JF66_19440 [Cryobacterium sp. MLB-32]|uniref:hypothetical protein n=1 Tax=Cryobacterium sp. MLB-32 TaxID=1529318 RepID=UPI0004E77F5F|nr:hypothetical protein [Cryobacterium sp. MLB-32]KFF58317.1 hypothetical protein JF66_19440 [Cryobacterium sp. MLB-32]
MDFTDATIQAALIGAAVAFLSVVVAAASLLIAWFSSLSETRSARKNHEESVAAQANLSREEREYEQLRAAYAPMLAYVAWAERAVMVLIIVTIRKYNAVAKVRQVSMLKVTEQDELAIRTAILTAGPLKWEQEIIDAGPTAKERFSIYGLTSAFASVDVRAKFDHLSALTDSIEAASAVIETNLEHTSRALGEDPHLQVVAERARDIIAREASMADASRVLHDATRAYRDAAEVLKNAARAELAPQAPGGTD